MTKIVTTETAAPSLAPDLGETMNRIAAVLNDPNVPDAATFPMREGFTGQIREMMADLGTNDPEVSRRLYPLLTDLVDTYDPHVICLLYPALLNLSAERLALSSTA
ncbi:MAG: hypothetical protein M3X11_11565 [Acidobacteriota bacterium]|nr:hypothetical protein [Acidobacteriota bacterium]